MHDELLEHTFDWFVVGSCDETINITAGLLASPVGTTCCHDDVFTKD